ncbi:Starch-binding associating with outer membrane [Mucilaginibacter sp. OK268]|uniref:RagB/SusD family nutrient uptake outer membrane protein n=1 Tax=Mucilaginibacter sp. OK268 TaxID=1881048 RepID=UPI00088F46B3|nr:RagB/SusD family nutrient uptake outer membrane protein [Mucilaginibacter sp. OK268]SDP90448.1 Starch-binding associating with outer membrane [Mucilaginibacter sp. OK268]
MKSYYKYLFMVALAITGVSCKKYLDVVPDNVGTIDYAFRNRNEAENYLFGCYNALQNFANVQTNVGFVTSGETLFPNDLTDNNSVNTQGFNLVRGTQSAQTPALNYWDGEGSGQALFKAIRKCNTMLENIDKPIDLSAAEKERWIAETKFLKAYYNYYLYRMYGPIPIIDVNLPINATTDETKVKRAPADSVVNYIVRLLDQAVPGLPPVIQNQAQELGRITKTIALCVKAEVLATAASPLFNGNPDLSSLKNKDGQVLFSATYDATKWDRAAAACLDAIKSAEANGARLHITTDLTANIPANLTDSLKKVLNLQTTITDKWETNPELIWALNGHFGFGNQEYFMPRLTADAASSLIAQGTIAAPISQQELFYTNNGVPINEDKTWDYANRYTKQTSDNANRFYIHNGYETVKAHFNREPRFYADLAFDGSVWYGNGKLGNGEDAYFVAGKGPSSYAGPKDYIRLNETGYWPKKLVNYLTVYDKTMTWEDFHLPVIRLAGMYLLYAEILNEQGKTSAEVIPYIDRVRTRAGLPGVVDAWTNYSKTPGKFTTKDGLRQIIHQERRIELAFEAQAGWDLRRWKELQDVMAKPLQGWSVFEESFVNYYRPHTIITPVFNTRNYMWPIKADNLIINNNLVQNPNW